MSLHQRPPGERLWVLLSGEPLRLCDVGFALRVSDEDLPIRLLWAGEGALTADAARTPGRIEIAKLQRYDHAKEYHWIPFWRPTDRDDSWRGNISYGTLQGVLQAEGEDIVLTVKVGPSILAESSLMAMKASLASLADELLTNADGRTRSEVGLAGGPPRSLRSFQVMLQRFLIPLLPFLRQIGRDPHEILAVRAPQRSGIHRAPVRSAVSLDCIENRFVAAATLRWRELLLLCAAGAENQASLLNSLAARRLPLAVDKADGMRRKQWKAEAIALTTRAEEARGLARELSASVPWASEVRSRAGQPRITPLISRDARYHAVFKAWWDIRRECVLVTPLRAASDFDAVASALFERWSVLALAWTLVKLGWEPVGFDVIADALVGTYDLEIRKAKPWTFRSGTVMLRFHYEPEFHKVKLGKSLMDPFLASLRQAALWEQRQVQFFSTSNFRTPDYLLEIILDDGRRSLVIGDALYCPIAPEYEPDITDSGPLWPSDRARAAFEDEYKLRHKLRKVKSDYAATCFFLEPDVGAIRACSHLGFVVYPGPTTSADWVGVLEPQVVPFPLLPFPSSERVGVENDDAVRYALAALLEAAVEAAAIPTPRPAS